MADVEQLKSYVGYYVSRGKAILSPHTEPLMFNGMVYQYQGYHVEFESFWQWLRHHHHFQDLYLDGDTKSFGQLLQDRWTVQTCARCDLPIPVPLTAAYEMPDCSVCDEATLQRSLNATRQALKGLFPQAGYPAAPWLTQDAAIAANPSSPAATAMIRVVVIGPAPEQRSVLERQLRCNGFEARFVNQVEDVIKASQTASLDLILLHAEISQSEAQILATQLRQHPSLQDTPIVALSAAAGGGTPWSEGVSKTQIYLDQLVPPWGGDHLVQQLRLLQHNRPLSQDSTLYWFPRPNILPDSVAQKVDASADATPEHSSLGKELEVIVTQQGYAITALQHNQAQLHDEINTLKSLNSLKDEFLNTVSHELRTPMTNIKMAIQMLEIAIAQDIATAQQQPATTPQSRTNHYLAILKQECEREISLINELLDLQRLDCDRHTSTFDQIQIRDWLTQVTEPFQARTQVAHQEFQLHLDDAVPQRWNTAPSDVARILSELLNNACKYTPIGCSISLTVHVVPSFLKFVVCNSGVEIPAANLPHLFEKFYRVTALDCRNQGGTGLGLALVQKLIEHLHGHVTVESVDRQTCFTVELPLQCSLDPLPSLCGRAVGGEGCDHLRQPPTSVGSSERFSATDGGSLTD